MEKLLEHNTGHEIFISDTWHVVSEIPAFLHISTPSLYIYWNTWTKPKITNFPWNAFCTSAYIPTVITTLVHV